MSDGHGEMGGGGGGEAGAGRAPQVDPRFENAVSMIRSGVFGWGDYFEPVLDSLSGTNDYYLLANDFPSYLEAQVGPCARTQLCPLHKSIFIPSSLRTISTEMEISSAPTKL